MPAGGKPKLAILARTPGTSPANILDLREIQVWSLAPNPPTIWRSDVTISRISRSVVFTAATMAPQVLDGLFRLGRALAG
jgi:hypothetical protein